MINLFFLSNLNRLLTIKGELFSDIYYIICPIKKVEIVAFKIRKKVMNTPGFPSLQAMNTACRWDILYI